MKLKTLNVFCEVKIFEGRSWNFSLSFQIFQVFRNLWSKALFHSQLPIVKITCKFAKNKTSERRGKQYVQTRKMSIKRKKARHWSSQSCPFWNFGNNLISFFYKKLTLTLAGGICDNHRPLNRFCGKLFVQFRYYPEFSRTIIFTFQNNIKISIKEISAILSLYF